MSASAQTWAEALASWAIPPEILAQAQEDPWAYPVSYFVRAAQEAVGKETPSIRRALGAMPVGGTVLDVGCGAGAASLPLAPPASALVGVDESAGMLEAFSERAASLGIAHVEFQGRWPDIAEDVGPADVVVCNHVLYNVPDIVAFAQALTSHARRRVVVEMTAEHPRAWMSALWRELHRIERPLRPTADDAVAVLAAAGIPPSVDRWTREFTLNAVPFDELVAMVRVDLCMAPGREDEIARALERYPPPAGRGIVTLWWDTH